MDVKFRTLTAQECEQLTAQGCTAVNWDDIAIESDFDLSKVHNCGIHGRVDIERGATLRNIGRLSGYRICKGAVVENVAVLETIGSSSFGNGVNVAAVNENGGRTVTIFNDITAQTAYITAMYRHRPKAIKHIEEIIRREYTEPLTSTTGTVSAGARITGCGIIRNVNIGEDAIIEGAAYLENGTIHSFAGQNTYIGAGVNCRDFIVCGNSRIDCGCVLERCFFGNGTRASALTAVDSLFFAGSHCDNCELCSVFAGPFTISHHKSTLLIAGIFSFFNAGSGTNQSNHLLKSGPVHQGVHQRGCKYGSDAYMMLPALDGAFTTIIGRHKNHPDTESFPFSILIENEGQSWLLPGANLAACGQQRDFDKWPRRDKRDTHSRDIIHFDQCNPFIAERIVRAIVASEELSAKESDIHTHKRMRIKSSMLRRGLKLYRLAYDKYIGVMLSGEAKPDSMGCGYWIDASGMYIPASVMNQILDDIENGTIDSTEGLRGAFERAAEKYDSYSAGWAYGELTRALGHTPTQEDISAAIERGCAATEKLNTLTEEDLRSEQDISMSVSYGIDTEDDTSRLADFKTVRYL